MINNFNSKLRFGTDVGNNFSVEFKKLQADIVKQIRKEFAHLAQIKSPPMRFLIASALVSVIKEQDVISGLMRNGYGMGEFGLVVDQARSFIYELEDYLVSQISIIPRAGPFSPDKINVVTDIFILVSYDDIGNLPSASYISDHSGVRIEWVKWLLTKGTENIIEGYKITYSPEVVNKLESRSGQAVMIKAKNGQWAVPSDLAGTSQDNFLTQAIMSNSLSGSRLSNIMRAFYQDIFSTIMAGR